MFDGRIADADTLIEILSDWEAGVLNTPALEIDTAASREATAKTLRKVIHLIDVNAVKCGYGSAKTACASDKMIIDYLTPEELLAGLAEEFAEGSQAALKLRRVLDGSNPTPKTLSECGDNLQEEFADVLLCLSEYLAASRIDIEQYFDEVRSITNAKAIRWLLRLQEKETADDKAGTLGK